MTASTQVKHLLHIVMIVISLFVLAAPIIDAGMIDNCTEKSVDTQDKEFEEDLEEDLEDKLEEKTKTIMVFNTSITYLFSAFSTTQPSYQLYLYTYKNNSSLYKPPILHS